MIGPEAPLAAGVADALTGAGFAVFGPTRRRGPDRDRARRSATRSRRPPGCRMARARAFSDAGRGHGLRAAAGIRRGRGRREGGRSGGGQGRDRLRFGRGGGPAIATLARPAPRRPGRRRGGARGRDRGAAAGSRGQRHRLVRRPVRASRSRWPATTSVCSTATAGPNTGGMGAYSPLPDLPDDRRGGARSADFHEPILAELARRGTPFRGALYAGFMLTADGPVLLECNARFGDPETQVILPRLAGPLGPVLLAAARGDLDSVRSGSALVDGRLPTLPGATVAIVLAAAGYPDAPRAGDPIDGLADAAATGALVFHAGTARDADGTYRTAGGRVLTVVGRGTGSRAPPRRPLSDGCRSHRVADGLQRRHDIAPIRARSGSVLDDPALHAARDGRDLVGHARASRHMLRVELAVARAQVARGLVPADALAALEIARQGRRRAHRRDRAHHRPRRHRVRQPGRRDGRARGPLPAPRADQQRRGRHRTRAPAARRGGATAGRRRPPARGPRSPGPGPRRAP